MAWHYDALKARGYSDKDITNVPIPELMAGMETWVQADVQR